MFQSPLVAISTFAELLKNTLQQQDCISAKLLASVVKDVQYVPFLMY